MLEFNEQNWQECLEAIGLSERRNGQFGGMTIYDDKGIPFWTYVTEEEKRMAYHFFGGMAYQKMRMELEEKKK